MAEVKYKPVWSEDGKTLSNVLVKNKLKTYNVVTEWYDGTPMDDSKIDSDLVYVKYDGKYLVRNFEYGKVLQKDTMQQMRDLSSYEILLLKMGVYKYVQLNGYYEKGDTPAPINYSLSDTDEGDDGGSVIELSGYKLHHDFNNLVNVKYYGVFPNSDSDSLLKINNALKNSDHVIIEGGEYVLDIAGGGFGSGGIKLRSGNFLEMGSNTFLKMKSLSSPRYNIIGVRAAKDVRIKGGVIIGDKYRHEVGGQFWKQWEPNKMFNEGDYLYYNFGGFKVISEGVSGNTPPDTGGKNIGDEVVNGGNILKIISTPEDNTVGEWGMGIWLHNCNNVEVEGTVIKECWGDGVYIGGDENDGAEFRGCKKVKILNVESLDNRRQGCSIVYGEDIYISKSSFSLTKGTNPQAGIDIEPNKGQYVKRVTVDGCFFKNNVGSGIEVAVHTDTSIIQDISIINCHLNNNRVYILANPSHEGVENINVTGNSFNIDNKDSQILVDRGVKGVVIKGNNLLMSGGGVGTQGIVVRNYCNDVDIVDNIIRGVLVSGVRVNEATNITIRGNLNREGSQSIYVSNSDGVSINNNYCYDNQLRGVYLSSCENSMICDNRVDKSNSTGIFIQDSTRPVIMNNIITDPRRSGINVIGESGGSLIKSNIIVGGSETIYGVGTIEDSSSEGSIISNNDFSGHFSDRFIRKRSLDVVRPEIKFSEGGEMNINESNSVAIDRLSPQTKNDAEDIENQPVFRPIRNTSPLSEGFPTQAGGGLLFRRGASSNNGYFVIYKGNEASRKLYLVYGNNKSEVFQLILSGESSDRPTDAMTGEIFFDTDLKKPIWWSGAEWVDSEGLSVQS